MSNNTKILVVEDEILIADFISQTLEDNNFSNIKIVNNDEDAKLEMLRWSPEVILMDINLNGAQKGIELSNKKNKEASVIFLTDSLIKVLCIKQSYLIRHVI